MTTPDFRALWAELINDIDAGRAAVRESVAIKLRAVLARYGTATPAPVVPIAERWPDEEDLPVWWMVRSDNPEFKGGEEATPTHWSSHSALMALNGRRARAMLDAEEEKQ